MKKGIHPQTHNDATVTCVCGNTFTTMSTQKTITVEICSACHPFYTGQQKFVDTEGRIVKFNKKAQLATDKKAATKVKADKKASTQTQGKSSLKDLLKEAKTETDK